MVDRQFAELRTAALYDALCGREQRDDFAFYLPLIMNAQAVLDVGCGTGSLLQLARESAHTGRLTGLDPAPGMMQVAASNPGIEWVVGDLSTASWTSAFDLVVMTGHAFQVLLTDDDVMTALAAIRSALTPDGVFAFETRNPRARAWERWTAGYGIDFVDADGTPARFTATVDGPMAGDLVTFTSTYQRCDWAEPEPSRSILRFLDADRLNAFLLAAGLVVDEQFGDWDRSPLTATSPEIITLARPATSGDRGQSRSHLL